MRLLALVQLLVLHHYRACCGGQDAPLVSILTLANGQTWCNRNALLNACYQSYPRHALELLLLEESLAPSSAFLHRAPRRLDPVAARGNSSHREGNYHWDTVLAPRLASEGALCGFPFRYFWFNASDQLDEVLRSDPNLRRRHSPNLGAKRNFLSFKASGDILANFDNDDFYHPNYLRRVVRKGFRADGGDGSGGTAPVALVSVEPEAEAVVNPDGTVAIAAPRADEVARRAAPGRECDGAGHKVAWSRAAVAACEWTPRNMNEEEGFWECARARGLRERVVTMDDAAADASDDGNALLMVKFVSGVSVSQAGFLVNIRDRAFLRRRDLRAQLQMQHAYYEQLHELARPAHLDHEHQSVTLRPGDVLYHPAGAWHRVECEGTGLSLNISLVLSSRADLVADALRQILWRDAAWRAPPCALAPPGAARGDAELAALVRDRLPAALEALTAAGTAGGLLPPCAACAPIRPRARRVFAGFGDSIDCEQIEEAEDGDDDDEDNDEDDDSGGNDGGGGGGEADDNDEQRAPTLDLLAAPHTRLRRNPLALLLRGDACRQRDGTGDKEPSGADDDDDDDDDDETPSRGERVRFIINVGFGNEELTSTSRCELFVPPHAASLVDTVGEYHEVGAGVFTASELLADAEPAPKKKAKHNSAATAPASTTKPRGRVPKGMAWSEDEKKWVLAEARGDESCAASRARVLEALVESGLLLIADR